MNHYLVTSKKKKKFIVETDYSIIAEFVKKNQDAKFRTIDYTGKTKILNRKKFLKEFIDATNDQINFFALCEILLPIYENHVTFISFMGYLKEYRQFRKDR